MKTKIYNSIKTIKVFCVIRGRNTLEEDELFEYHAPKNRWIKSYLIFPNKTRALKWVNHWRNKDDFTVVESTIEIPEAN